MDGIVNVLIRVLFVILLMPIYFLINIILAIISVLNALLGKIGGLLGFFLILFGILELIGAGPIEVNDKTGAIISLVLGALCYIIPIVIEEIITKLQEFSGWIMETIADA